MHVGRAGRHTSLFFPEQLTDLLRSLPVISLGDALQRPDAAPAADRRHLPTVAPRARDRLLRDARFHEPRDRASLWNLSDALTGHPIRSPLEVSGTLGRDSWG